MHRQYLHAGDRALAYYDSAPRSADARTLVLLHAFPLSGSMWEPQFKSVPKGWRLVAPDLRGFGGSSLDHEPETPSIDDYAADVIDLLRELDIHSAVIGGCSMGGYVAFGLLRLAPHVAKGLILADTRAGADTIEGRAGRRAMLVLLEREGPPGIARDMLPKLLGRTTLETSPTTEASLRRVIKQQSANAIRAAVVRMMHRPDSTATIQSVSVPTLVIVGEEDTVTPPQEARKLAAAIANAELVVVPRAGHLASLEQPSSFNAAVETFLSRL
jgi:pimeloyl-ACP methyl ester carboxylesterase